MTTLRITAAFLTLVTLLSGVTFNQTYRESGVAFVVMRPHDPAIQSTVVWVHVDISIRADYVIVSGACAQPLYQPQTTMRVLDRLPLPVPQGPPNRPGLFAVLQCPPDNLRSVDVQVVEVTRKLGTEGGK